MLPIIVFISGNGSNLQALIDDKNLPVTIRAVISNEADAGGLARAEKAGIPTRIISHKDFDSREAFDTELARTIDQFEPQLIVLAGFMRRLGDDFVNRYLGRLINIHPSLLPRHPGLNTHQQVLESGEQEHGASTHFVIPELDAGPILFQAALNVDSGEDEATLKARVLALEHQLYPHTVREIALGNVTFQEGQAYFMGKLLPKEGVRVDLSTF